MLDSEVVFPIVGQALVEGGVVFLGDVVGVASPDGLGLVKLLVGGLLLLDLLGLLLLLFLLFVNLLDLGLVLGLILDFLILILNLLYSCVSVECNVTLMMRLTFSTSLVTASWMG